jgi:hypothetical protein
VILYRARQESGTTETKGNRVAGPRTTKFGCILVLVFPLKQLPTDAFPASPQRDQFNLELMNSRKDTARTENNFGGASFHASADVYRSTQKSGARGPERGRGLGSVENLAQRDSSHANAARSSRTRYGSGELRTTSNAFVNNAVLRFSSPPQLLVGEKYG